MIQIIDYTEHPLETMGECASICWDSNPSPKIAVSCIESEHGRVSEYATVIAVISGYSARVMREIYTHIIGTSRLQASTRYINYMNMNYYVPQSIENNEKAKEVYDNFMMGVQDTYKQLLDLDIPKQDIANILPLGMHSKMVLKINARALMHMAEMRLCTRALKEFRDFMKDLLAEISKLNDEWAKIVSYCKPKCLVRGYCTEHHSCGLRPKKEVVMQLIDDYMKNSKGDIDG